MPAAAEAPVLLGVIGWPVRHSRSPAMHTAALAALGLDWRYVRLPVSPALFAETVCALAGSGYLGVNVTIPHKEAALALADAASPAARAIGAANTLTFLEDGAVEADNTDAGGLIDALEESPPGGSRAVVLGAGGAGRAAAYGLREAGAAEVLLWNRTPERAAAVAGELGVTLALDVRGAIRDADLLVNSTSVGLAGGVPDTEALAALGMEGADPPPTVVDLVYGSAATPVARWAHAGGARVVDGLEVLVRQGARSLELWTGGPAPLDVMRRAARA